MTDCGCDLCTNSVDFEEEKCKRCDTPQDECVCNFCEYCCEHENDCECEAELDE